MTQPPLTLDDWRALDPGARADARAAACDDPAIFIARAEATDDGTAGPLAGIPLAVKDNIDVAGLPTTAACPAYGYRPSQDAGAVARLRAAGMVPAGKTNLDQFATGLVGTRSPYGVPRNPFDPAAIPGGSSSGSAVAVARGLVPAALGTDTAGSGRVPAMMCNLVGLKPTRGLISTAGVVPACRSLDCVSIFALTVPDAVELLRSAAGVDPSDPFSRAIALSPGRDGPPRIAVPAAEAMPWHGDPEGPRWFARAVERLRDIGATIATIDPRPLLAAAALLYDGPWVAERTAAVGDFVDAHWDECDPTVRAIVRGGRSRTAVDAYRGLYRLQALTAAAAPIWRAHDALVVPTAPRHWTVAEVRAEPVARNAALGAWTNFVNLMDLAALAVPTGFHPNGLPVGVSLVGPAGSDLALARIGGDLHAAGDLPLGASGARRPAAGLRLAPSPPAAGAIPIVVFGAHLTGESRSAALAALGATCDGAVRTAAAYRMVLLDGPLPRPGLVRAEGGGAAIEGERWLVPSRALAGLIEEVRPPLALGTVELDDGSMVRGFVCAAGAEAGAPDITRFGGWRGWRASLATAGA